MTEFRELLLAAQDRARKPQQYRTRDDGRARLYRAVVQPTQASLEIAVPEPGGFRSSGGTSLGGCSEKRGKRTWESGDES
jgi:hypothetical protein